MTTILVRFAELGLKSERVRSRFLGMLADDIEEGLVDAGIEHLMDVKRSRIFIETDRSQEAGEVLRNIPGVFSFSIVDVASSDRERLMEALSDFGRSRIGRSMTYGLKVRRSGDHPYTSQEIAVEGGGAVVSHLEEGEARVDLKDPDIWIEVEIRNGRAYIFDNRTKGLGGMPSSSQGKVLLLLPEHEGSIEDRVLLSYALMRRRGCKVIPAAYPEHSRAWADFMVSHPMGKGREPFILRGVDPRRALIDAVSKLRVWGIVIPCGPGEESRYPVLHSDGTPISQFYPTISMEEGEIGEWMESLYG